MHYKKIDDEFFPHEKNETDRKDGHEIGNMPAELSSKGSHLAKKHENGIRSKAASAALYSNALYDLLPILALEQGFRCPSSPKPTR